jgi:hypothetical protein
MCYNYKGRARMTKRKMLLACLAAAKGDTYEPVQIQKLVFLFQEKAPDLFKKKPFTFFPYNYGPFDQTIYAELDQMSGEGLVRIWPGTYGTSRSYDLTADGKKAAEEVLGKMEECFRDFLIHLSAWVRSVSFAALVGAIYKEFPEMKVNSVFRD